MRGALALGARLACHGRGPGRLRTGLVGVATAVGVLVLLTVVAVARAEQTLHPDLYAGAGGRRLLLAILLTVTLPVVVLAATAGRLSAELRDRRLANLRLLGMTPLQTRCVVVTEAAVAAGAGVVLGCLLFVALRPLVAGISVAGRSWPLPALVPRPGDYALVVGLVLVVAVAVSALPQRLDMVSVLSRARRADARKPSLGRLLPLAVGVILCAAATGWAENRAMNQAVFVGLVTGIALLGIGLVVVVPVFVRLLADLLLRFGRGPVATVAARRLQAQPVGVSRVVAGLLVGLFLVTAARAVVVSFESTPQYLQAARQVAQEQRVVLMTTAGESAQVTRRAEQVEGVRRTVILPVLESGSGCDGDATGPCLRAVVASCKELQQAASAAAGCRPGRAMWLTDDPDERALAAQNLTWSTLNGLLPVSAWLTTAPTETAGGDAAHDLEPVTASLLLPPAALEGRPLPAGARVDVLVIADAGRGLADRLGSAGVVELSAMTAGDVWPYDVVAGLRAIVWSIAAVVLSVGLLAFVVAAIDRAVSRRREIVALQLVGVPASVLRRTQWLEAALPIGTGMLLAIGLGLLAGTTYLALDDAVTTPPWSMSLTLAGISCISAMAVAGLTVLAANPRVRPNLIRAE